uniref:Putative ovule protein n=1 Tax=Solanum chacoense TaxID=4108 RepID=A0A0V0INN9_SOLCH
MLEIVLLLFQIGISKVHLIPYLMRYNATTFILYQNCLALSLWANNNFRNCSSVFNSILLLILLNHKC